MLNQPRVDGLADLDSDGWRIVLGLGLPGLGIVMDRIVSSSLVTMPTPTLQDVVALASVTALGLAGVAGMFMHLFRKAMNFLTKHYEKWRA